MFAVLAGLATFSTMDAFMKAAAIAIGAYSATFWRNCLGAGMAAPLWLWRGSGWPDRHALRLHLTRGTVAAGMAVLFFYGLVRTPMAEAMALSFVAPLLALYLAAAILGETIGRRAVAGSLLAFAGVVVIGWGRLGTGSHDAESLKGLAAVLASAVLYAWNLVLQRQQAQLAGPEEIAFFQPLTVAIALGMAAPWLATFPDRGTWLPIAAAAFLAGTSLLLLSWAYARAEAQVLVPLEYSAFVWAALAGWVAFREPIGGETIAGVVLIVCGCLYATRERTEATAL